MFRLIKAEISYNKYQLFGFSTLMVIMVMVEIFQIEALRMMYFLIPFLMVNALFGCLRKEKRERLDTILPITGFSVAVTRLMLIYLPFLSTVALYTLFGYTIGLSLFSETLPWIAFMGLFIVAFSIYLVIQDLTANTQRVKNAFSNKGYILIVISVMLLFGTVLLAKAASGESLSPLFITLIGRFFDFMLSQVGAIIIYSLSIIFAGLSIYSFLKRKSYLCN